MHCFDPCQLFFGVTTRFLRFSEGKNRRLNIANGFIIIGPFVSRTSLGRQMPTTIVGLSLNFRRFMNRRPFFKWLAISTTIDNSLKCTNELKVFNISEPKVFSSKLTKTSLKLTKTSLKCESSLVH